MPISVIWGYTTYFFIISNTTCCSDIKNCSEISFLKRKLSLFNGLNLWIHYQKNKNCSPSELPVRFVNGNSNLNAHSCFVPGCTMQRLLTWVQRSPSWSSVLRPTVLVLFPDNGSCCSNVGTCLDFLCKCLRWFTWALINVTSYHATADSAVF